MYRILLVDDEILVRDAIKENIDWEGIGCQLVGDCENGQQAAEFVKEHPVDIVLTDILMPYMDGMELSHFLHDNYPDIVIVIFSGFGEFEYAKKAMQYGVKHYLLKPCNEEQIIESLQDVIKDYTNYLATRGETPQTLISRNINQNLMVGIINDSLSLEAQEADTGISQIACNYKQYLDFEDTRYEMFYVYYVIPDNYKEVLIQLRQFRNKHFPGIRFSVIYVYNTLVFFFPAMQLDLSSIYHFLDTLSLSQPVSIEYRHESYSNLQELLKVLIQHLRKYEIIYFAEDTTTFSIYNYQNIIKEVQKLTSSAFSEQDDSSSPAFQSLLCTLQSISDADFLKQLAASVIIFSVSNNHTYDMVTAAEFLVKLEQENDCSTIFALLKEHLAASYEEYHSSKHTGDISQKIMEYVEKHIEDAELSLKWIAENYLYMNVDYLSKKFLKETGCKFSKYLTDTRIKKAKEILASGNIDSIQCVADMVGCENNPQYFSQIFKKSTGMTPSKYIKMIRGE